MQESSFYKYLERKMTGSPIVEAAMNGFVALFEGLNPGQKTRRAIRNLLPEPPGGWDSPAMTEDGNEVISQHGNVLTWAVCLETYIRETFFHDRNVADKFEPGIARIAYTEMGMWPEGVEDYRGSARNSREDLVPQIRSILRMFTGAHLDEIDFDLNGMTLDDLVTKFGNAGKTGEVDDTEDTGSTDYRVIHVESFEEARKFHDMFEGENRWCIVSDRDYWNRYTKRGKYTAYFLMSPDAENVPMEQGDGCPKDRYGKSLVGIMIGPDGSVEFCCVRWNHMNGGSDHEMSEKELSEMLGRPVRMLCPYMGAAERSESLATIKARLDAGEKPLDIYDRERLADFPTRNLNWDLVKYSLDDGRYLLLDRNTMLPKWDIEITETYLLDDTCLYCKSVADESDDYGDDIVLHYLLRKDGQYTMLGASDDDYRDSSLLAEDIDNVAATPIPGVYEVECTYRDENDNQVLVTSKFTQLSGFHGRIEYRTADRLICCDLSHNEFTDENDTDDNCPEVISYDGGKFRYILSQRRYWNDGEPRALEYAYPTHDTVNMMYLLDNHLYALLGGREQLVHEDCEGMKMLGRMYKAQLVLVKPYIGLGMIFDMGKGKFTMNNLTDCDAASGVISTDRGGKMKNLLSPNGTPLLKNDWPDIRMQISINSPWYNGDEGRVAFECKDGDGRMFLVDWPSGKPAYDRPLPEHSMPYTNDLYIKPVEDRYAICRADTDEPCSEEFDAFESPTMYRGTLLRRENKGKREYTIFDVCSGKAITPWMNDEPDRMYHSVWPGIKEALDRKASEIGIPANSDEYFGLYTIQSGRDHERVAAFNGTVWAFHPMGAVRSIQSPVRLFGTNPFLTVLTDEGEWKLYDLGLNQYLQWNSTELDPILTALCDHFDPEHKKGDEPVSERLLFAMEKAGNWIEWVKKNMGISKGKTNKLRKLNTGGDNG